MLVLYHTSFKRDPRRNSMVDIIGCPGTVKRQKVPFRQYAPNPCCVTFRRLVWFHGSYGSKDAVSKEVRPGDIHP